MAYHNSRQFFNTDYSILIFATNNLSYLKFAFTSARSILLFNDINIYIVSNLKSAIPSDIKKNVFFIPAAEEHAALGIGMKLYIDKYIQTKYNLFIDADCICYDNLKKLFDCCGGMAVSVVGYVVPAANWCGEKQADTIKSQFGIKQLIRYNGGIYYINKLKLTTTIFNTAREIAESYDDYGFQRIKNIWLNEEGPLSIAMILNNQKPIADDGKYMTDLFTNNRPSKLNVLKGLRELINPAKPSIKHRPWYPFNYSPVILHFGGSSLRSFPYNSQYFLLKLNSLGAPAVLASAITNIFINLPYKTFHWLTGLLKR